MPSVTIEGLAQLRELLGREVAVSDWFEVDQARINRFADAIEDRQWIHLDEERARRESPYGATVAHGFLTLSLLSYLTAQAIQIQGVKLRINYGLNRVRFPAPLPAGSFIRARISLQTLDDLPGGVQATWSIIIERQGTDKPCCVAEWVNRIYTHAMASPGEHK